MPATIADLLLGKPDLVTTTQDANIKDVLAEMVKYDYSQLPVVDDHCRPVGLVTSDSIVRALHNFNVKTSSLRVRDAMVKTPERYYPNDDVFDLLDDLESDEVILVIDSDEKLIGIITTYDTTRYLRQRAEDIMVVREVEEMVKGYTNAAFTNPSGDIDIQRQKAAIAEITPSNLSNKGRFRKALVEYLKQRGEANPQIDDATLDAAFMAHLYDRPSIRPFDKLSLGEYINLFLHQSRWASYSSIFSLDREAIRHLLDAVRQTRNALAHFRDDITPQQREVLRFCKEWLARHEGAINVAFGAANGAVISPGPAGEQSEGHGSPPEGTAPVATDPGTTTEPVTVPSDPTTPTPVVDRPPPTDEVAPAPLDELPSTGTGRYAPLIRRLVEQPAHERKLTLTFDDIDALLGEHRLPESARKFRAWWANDSVSHSQSQQWLEAGWRVSNINMAEERVTFARNTEHETAYLAFFTELQRELEQKAPGMFRFASSGGQYWLTVDAIRFGTKTVASFFCSFTRTKRFRVELYLDTYDKATTKQLYDALAERKEAIEAKIGDRLSWERLDEQRPSRVARYYAGSITDTTGALANLRARAVEATTRFVPVLRQHLEEIVPSVLGSAVAEPAAETTQ